jgi:aromatic-L-amino-acid decarboxylase
MDDKRPVRMSDDLPEDPDQFRRLGERFLDTILSFWGETADRPVHPGSAPEDFAALAGEEIPAQGQPLDEILAEFSSQVLPGLTQVASPRYLGMMNPPPAPVAVFAEGLTAALNQNCALWHQSPAGAELEKTVIRWFCRLAGLPEDGAFGALVNGGSMANITALKLARDRAAGPEVRAAGLGGQPPLAVYISEEGHYSFDKGMDLIGLGTALLRRIPVDAEYRIDVPRLHETIAADTRRGIRPAAVVGVAGTTNTGSIDPLEELADAAAGCGAWFHVDAAYGGAALMLPEFAAALRGVARADSVTLDPHKWFFLPFECAAILVRDGEGLRAAFSTRPHYYLEQGRPGRTNFFEHGLQGSRSLKALKTWLTFKFYGLDYYRTLIRRNIAFAAWLHRRLFEEPDFEPFHRPELGIACFRVRPSAGRPQAHAFDEERLDELNRRIHRRIEREGRFWISITRLRGGRVALRVNFMNYRTRPEHVEELAACLIRMKDEELAS